jgi:hypothetical protein
MQILHEPARRHDMPSRDSFGGAWKVLTIGALGLLSLVTTAAQTPPSAPVDLPQGPAKRGFDLKRFSSAGNGWFETFYVESTQPLQQALEEGKVAADTRLLVTETAAGKLALLMDQMAYHHLAQGRAGGKDWLATF